MFTFNKNYFILAVFLFVVEVFIAIYINDAIVRPYVGDYLVVILMYCAVKAFLKVGVLKLAIAVLLFAYLMETLQYLDILTRLGLQDHRLARVVLGHSFEWIDMLAYTLGIATVVWIESYAKDRMKRMLKA